MTQQNKDIPKDKETLLEKMLDPASTLTDAELEMIFQDDELREIYEVSTAVRGASIQQRAIDAEQEWLLFRHRIMPKPSPWRWMMRVAAIFLGVLMVSAIAKIGIDRIMTDDKASIVGESTTSRDSTRNQVPTIPATHDTDRVTLAAETGETVAPAMVSKPKRSRPVPSSARLEEDDEIDIDEYLRLQQARIDNEVALIEAELYIEQLQALNEAELPEEGEEESDRYEVRYIIMQ